jgi:EAL domain-containing protein (putative c-di-GMP-specific phosphodiesterase class I)/CheY-like chemotaxis protein
MNIVKFPKLSSKLRVMVLTLDNDHAERMTSYLEAFGVIHIYTVGGLMAAASILQQQVIDIIISEIHADRTDGLMLPSIVSELNIAGEIRGIPHIIWTAEPNPKNYDGPTLLMAGLVQGWQETLNGISTTALLSHVRLAQLAGIHIEIARDGGADCLFSAMNRLATLAPQRPQSSFVHFANLPTEDDVVAALASGEGLRVVYQPQYNLQTKQIVGAEALIRWSHPRYGDVPPSVLVPMVNELGLDLLLFSYIEKNVISMLVTLDRAGIKIPLAVNASSKTLSAPGLAVRLSRKMHDAGLPTQRLKIELTEDVAPANRLALSASITSLRSKGFPVSLDDFGAGAATLALLSQLPFDEMKIDGTLVRAVGQTATSIEVISGVVALAKSFNLKLVTEGIEDESTLLLLDQLGCEVGQGYALAYPLENDVFIDLLHGGDATASIESKKPSIF